MKIYFSETEQPDEEFFRSALPDHELAFGPDLTEVDPATEILCVYIQSRIDAAFLDAHPAVKLIVTRSTGIDHIDVRECLRRHIILCDVPGTNATTVAEHTFALMLALSRRLFEVHEAKKEPRFYYKRWRGFDLEEKTLGVIGTGRIGLRVIHIALAFGMKVLAHDRYHHSRMAEIQGTRYVPLDELLRESHVVTLHTPLTAETYHLLDREAFSKCRTGVLIINTARGAVVDTDALIEAMDAGIVGGLGLDVLEEESVMRKDADKIIVDQIVERLHGTCPQEEQRMRDPGWIEQIARLFRNQQLLSRPNVVFTPHVAFNSVEAVERMSRMTVENILAFLKGEPINVVEVPPHGLG